MPSAAARGWLRPQCLRAFRDPRNQTAAQPVLSGLNDIADRSGIGAPRPFSTEDRDFCSVVTGSLKGDLLLPRQTVDGERNGRYNGQRADSPGPEGNRLRCSLVRTDDIQLRSQLSFGLGVTIHEVFSRCTWGERRPDSRGRSGS
jgi:hypothetical protein